jgi:alkanesulfonate monooxygenase SsuD/methylene tetrahydromethanopterin reductase-like flavin-dependent oxidoreductase (luciferase family)
MQPDVYVDMATQLERAGFDYILIEDTTSIDDTYGSSMETTLARGFMAPKNDPLPLVPLMSRATKRIGIVPTISTSFYPPYMAARVMTTLDHLTQGRVGINVVTSVNHRAAQNFGLDRHLEHDLLTGAVPGRTSDEDLTCYASVGLAGTEVLLASRVLGRPSTDGGPA